MTIWPSHVAVLNHYNGTDIKHNVNISEWPDTVNDLVDHEMLSYDAKRKTWILTDRGRGLLRILHEQWKNDQMKSVQLFELRLKALQPKIDIIKDMIQAMEADDRILVFRELGKVFSFDYGTNR